MQVAVRLARSAALHVALVPLVVGGAGCASSDDHDLRPLAWDAAVVRDGRAFVGLRSNLRVTAQRVEARVVGTTAVVTLLTGAEPQRSEQAIAVDACHAIPLGRPVAQVLDGSQAPAQARRKAERPRQSALARLRAGIRGGRCTPLPAVDK